MLFVALRTVETWLLRVKISASAKSKISNISVNRQQKITSKTPLILNGKLFQVTEESSDGKIKAKCCLCPASKPPLSGSKNATSNILFAFETEASSRSYRV